MLNLHTIFKLHNTERITACFRPKALNFLRCTITLLISFFFLTAQAATQTPIVLDPIQGVNSLVTNLVYLEDHDYSFEYVSSEEGRQLFTAHASTPFNGGVIDHSYWFKSTVMLPATASAPTLLPPTPAQQWKFGLDYQRSHQIELYYRSGDKLIHKIAGSSLPMSQRDVRDSSFFFNVELQPGVEQEIYFRIHSMELRMMIPFYAFSADKFAERQHHKDLFNVTIYTIIGSLALYNIFLVLIIRQKTYFYYSAYLLSAIFTFLGHDGLGNVYLWGESTYLSTRMTFIIAPFGLFLYMRFASSFLWISARFPTLAKGVRLLEFVSLLVIPISIFADLVVINYIMAFYHLIVIFYVLYIAIVSTINKVPSAQYLLISEIVFIIGIVSNVVSQIVIGNSFVSNYALHFGISAELILLSLAMADRFNILQKEKNQAQAQALEAAESSNRLKNDFLMIISHELRTPMNGVDGSLELLLTADLAETERQYVSTAKQSSVEMMKLVDSMLEFSEVHSGVLSTVETCIHLQNFLKPIIDNCKVQCSKKGLQFTTDIDPTIPEYLILDDTKMSHILDKILDNAIKFTNKGGISFNVRLLPLHASRHYKIEFTINDSGIGITKKLQKEIFSSFLQAETSYNRSYGGLGIGLSLCKGLAELIGGEITFNSEPEKGSTFTFVITLKEGKKEDCIEVPTYQRVETKNQQDNSLFDNEPPKILIVEDNQVNLMVLTRIIEKIGYTVFQAQNGLDALNFLNKNLVDIILMDCQMPIMDGFQATREIRKCENENKMKPIIAVTANVMSGDRERCIHAGMNDYIKKPVTADIIYQKLQQWLYS